MQSQGKVQNLRELASRLANPFGHLSQVCMQVLVLQTCIDLRVRLARALKSTRLTLASILGPFWVCLLSYSPHFCIHFSSLSYSWAPTPVHWCTIWGSYYWTFRLEFVMRYTSQHTSMIGTPNLISLTHNPIHRAPYPHSWLWLSALMFFLLHLWIRCQDTIVL